MYQDDFLQSKASLDILDSQGNIANDGTDSESYESRPEKNNEIQYRDIDYSWSLKEVCENLILICEWGIQFQISRKVNSHHLEEKNLVFKFFMKLNQNLSLLNAHLEKNEPITEKLQALYEIGAGGEARVHRAFDRASRKSYAQRLITIKFEEFESRLKELKIIFTLIRENNPGLLKFYRVIFVNNHLEILMEYGVGDFRSFLMYFDEKHISLEEKDKKKMAHQMKKQYELLKSFGIYHRDIKPENMILTENLEIKYTDFGYAEIWDGKSKQKFKTCGTPGYWHTDLQHAFDHTLREFRYDLDECDLYSIQVTIERDLKLKYNPNEMSIQEENDYSEVIKNLKKEYIINQESKIKEDSPALFHQRYKNLLYTELHEQRENLVEQFIAKKDKKNPENFHLIIDQCKLKLHNHKFGQAKELLCILSERIESLDEKVEKIALILKAKLYLLKSEFIQYQIDPEKDSNESLFEKGLKYYHKAVEIYTNIEGDHRQIIAEISLNSSIILLKQARFEESRLFCRQALDLLISLYGENHDFVAATYSTMGTICMDQGKYEDAGKFYWKTLEIQRLIYGEHHSKVGSGYSSLGNLYMQKQEFEKAFKYYQKSLQIHMKISGEDCENVLITYANLGELFRIQSKFEESREYFYKSKEIGSKFLEKNHTKLGFINSYLAKVNLDCAKYPEALELYSNALDIWLKNFDKSHPLIAETYSQIGIIYTNMSKYEQGLENLIQARKIRSKFFGDNHSTAANDYLNIGRVYLELGKFNDALSHFEESKKIAVGIFGEINEIVAKSYHNIGKIQSEKAQFQTALASYSKSLQIQIKLFGDFHYLIAITCKNIGDVYYRQSKYKEALFYFEKSLFIDKKIFGQDNHTSFSETYSKIGSVYSEQRNFDKALMYHRKALNISIKLLEDNTTEVASISSNIGNVLLDQGKFDEALQHYQKSLSIDLQKFGPNHPSVAISYSHIGIVHCCKGRYKDAIEHHMKSLEIDLKFFGKVHTKVSKTLSNLAVVYERQGRFNEAFQNFFEALNISKEIYQGECCYEIGKLYDSIANLYQRLNNITESNKYWKKSLEINIKIFGDNHPVVLNLKRKLMN